MTAQSFRLVNEQVKHNAIAAIAAAKIGDGEIMTVCIAPEEKKRSVQQNRYLWGVVYKTIVDNDPGFFVNDAVDALRKTARLSAAEVVHEFCKALPAIGGLARFADYRRTVHRQAATQGVSGIRRIYPALGGG
jgi:hypothetical protein